MIRTLLGRRLRPLLKAITARMDPPRVINDGDTPYLSRWYLRGVPTMPDGSPPFDTRGEPREAAVFPNKGGIDVYLHKFHRGNNDAALHDHPWSWGVSLILAGGYVEERRMGRAVVQRILGPLSLNVLTADDFHRVDLIEDDAWTLFVVGPKIKSWGFWLPGNPVSKITPWRKYLGIAGA